MSIESAKAFYARMTTDAAFRTQLQRAANKAERKQILQVAGYEFTPAEWETVTDQIQALTYADKELSDAQLQAVSGGVFIVPLHGKAIADWVL